MKPIARLPWHRTAIEKTAWLADDTLLTVGWSVAPLEPLSARLVAAGRSTDVEARWTDYPRPDLPGVQSAGRIAVLHFPAPLDAHQSGRIAFQCGSAQWSASTASLHRIASAPRAVVAWSVGWLDANTRARILEFLGDQLRATAAVVSMAENLAELREVLRAPLRERPAQPTEPCAAGLDLVLRIDECSFYVKGWAYAAESPVQRLTIVSPEGHRADIAESAFRFGRADLEDPFGDATRDLGFAATVRLRNPSYVRDGWLVELVLENGVGCQSAPCAVVAGSPGTVRDLIVADVDLDRSGRGRFIELHVSQAIDRLRDATDATTDAGMAGETIRYGEGPSQPDVSVIVPLYHRLDLMEQQVAQFSLDPGFAQVELIYVLDSPELADQLKDLACELHDLYRLAFTVIFLPRNAGYAAANNAAARAAAGRLLLLLNSDVFPSEPGWLLRMRDFYDTTPRIGALGVKLLYEDETLQHAGMYFRRQAADGVWQNEHYFKGLQRRFAAANVARTVPAVTGACLMISRARFEQHRGFSGIYIRGDYEDSDLCLKLLAAGHDNWYLPGVELYHLEGQSYGWRGRSGPSRYNAWKHTQLWNDTIERCLGRFEP